MAKPSRGYGWTCAPCSRKHEEAVDSHELRHPTPVSVNKIKSNAPAARGRGRPRKDKTLAEKEENLPVKHFNMWPFRYFGQVLLCFYFIQRAKSDIIPASTPLQRIHLVSYMPSKANGA